MDVRNRDGEPVDVWAAPPAWVTIPPGVRFQRLFYLAVVFGLVLIALTVPLTV